MKALMYLEREVRTHDHAGLKWLADNKCEVSFVSFLEGDISDIRQNFHLESLLDFQAKFKGSNAKIHLLQGDPGILIPQIFKKGQFDFLIKDFDLNSNTLERTRKWLHTIPAAQIIEIRPNTLISPQDLPFSMDDMPRFFTDFRKKVELNLLIQDTCTFEFPNIKVVDLNFKIPEEISITKIKTEINASNAFCLGGETAALRRVEDYFGDVESVLHYKELRNGMISLNHSTKFSPYLANGNLSARFIYKKIKEFENTFGANESTYWILFELLWRDYFKFLSLKIKSRLFGSSLEILDDAQTSFQAWKEAKTSEDFVNANLNEMHSTGWMSNRGRQNVASYLAKTLNGPWTLGAEHFRHHLIDYDTESNWGNWLYLSDQGTDPRNRIFNVKKQAEMYDPHREYINKWLHEKANKGSRS